MTFRILTAVSAFVFMGASISFAQEETQRTMPRPAKVFTVAETSSELRREYPALVLPSNEVELSFRVSGQVIDLPVRPPQDVKAGDLIAALDDTDFRTQVSQLESQITQAEAELRALKTGARTEEIAALEAAVASAQAQVDQAKEQAERTRELVQRGVAAQAQQERDDASLSVAEANLKAQQEQLQIGLAGGRPEEIEGAEAAIKALGAQLEIAQNNLDHATLEAPFDGTVSRRDIENFSNVQAGQSVVLLQALSVIHMAFDVPGSDVTGLTANGPEAITTTVEFDALPGQKFEGETAEFSLQADAATQTYRGRVAVTMPKEAFILPGMVGRVIASTPRPGGALRIPLTAVAAQADSAPFVWVLDASNAVQARPVTLGEMSGATVDVTEGLAAGDRIVAAGVSQLIEGMVVRPVERIGG